MSKFILAAVDLAHPETAQAILRQAKKLARMEEANLAVVTVVPDFGMSIVGSFFQEGTENKIMHHATDELHKLVTDVLGEGKADGDIHIKHIVKHGPVYEQIIEAARELESPLIVMGAHRPELRDYLIGPNATRVVRHAPVSVYVVRS